jgi:hypothetical protein
LAERADRADEPVMKSTLRIGLLVSVLAALFTIALEITVHAPAIAIVIPVVIIGFALSWHASGHGRTSTRGS